MAETDVRISELTDTTTSAANDDYIALDGATYGTRKMLASNLVGPEASARAAGDEALDEQIGTLSNLTTTAKGSAVAAINEVDSHADTAQNTADNNAAAIGTLSSLTTDAKGSLVAAINEVDSHADGKVDKVNGKGLSTNDYTDAEKTKLSGIEAGAEVNDVTSVAGKTGAVTLAGGDVSYSDETTYADGTVGAAISGLKSDLNLLLDAIPNTTQSYTFSDGQVSQITHTRDDSTVRTDAFVYGTGTITETRTLSTGETLTIQTNLTTLETVITYSAA